MSAFAALLPYFRSQWASRNGSFEQRQSSAWNQNGIDENAIYFKMFAHFSVVFEGVRNVMTWMSTCYSHIRSPEFRHRRVGLGSYLMTIFLSFWIGRLAETSPARKSSSRPKVFDISAIPWLRSPVIVSLALKWSPQNSQMLKPLMNVAADLRQKRI